MPNLPISLLPLATSGQPDSLMVIVNYDVDPGGVTNSIYYSSITEQFSGSTGSSGTSGTSGVDGKSSSLFIYSANTSTTSGDPGAGHILWNNSTQTGSTQINISHLTAFDDDIDVYLSLLIAGQQIILQDKNVAENYQTWLVTSNATFVFPDYWTVPVSLIGSNGQGSTNFDNDHELALIIISADGSSGTSGTSGLDGTSGTSGVDGSSGTSGISGTSGLDGTSGTSGVDGSSGTSGISGTSGVDGTSGTSGVDGSSGTSGIDGTSGTSGVDGSSGTSGTSGVDGSSGTSGTSGTDGSSGLSGVNGTDGTSGTDGSSGTSGDSGTSGLSFTWRGDYNPSTNYNFNDVVYYNGSSYISIDVFNDNTGNTPGSSPGYWELMSLAGLNGSSGTSGTDGTSGTSGSSGSSGTTGTSGSSGSSGFSGDLYRTTSTTSLTIQTGSTGTFVVGTNLGYSIAQDVIIAYDLSNHMIGMVVSYNPSNGNMVVNVETIIGSGSFSSWTVNLAGAAGGDGSSGTSGSSGVDGTSGSDGSSGADGTSGSSGSSGSSGTSGTSGTSGSSGSSGTSGSSGSSGTTGTSGSSGSSGTSGTSGSSGSSGTTGTSGSSGVDGNSGSAGTSGSSGTSAPTPPYPFVYGLFAQTGNSIAVSATTVETTVIGPGLGTLSVPASGFTVGDSFRCDFGGYLSAKNNDTLTIRIKTGSIVLADSGPQTMTTSVNDIYQLSINFTIRQVGGPGVGDIVTLGVFHTTKQSNGAQGGFAFNTINNTTFDTTVSNTLDVTAQFSSNSPLNSIYTDIFVLNKIY